MTIEIKTQSKLNQLKPVLIEISIVIAMALLAVVINSRMIRDGLNGGLGDLLWHITWIQHFSEQVFEGFLYPRWLAGTNYGYGSPTFVFYPPVVYYFGSFLKGVGLNIEQTLSFLFTFCLFLSGTTFYIFGRHRWGHFAGVIGAIYYMSSLSIFRSICFGGLAGGFSSALLPLGVYLSDRVLQSRRWCIPLTLFWGLIALTHVPSLLLFTLVWFSYLIFLSLRTDWKTVIPAAISSFLGFGLSGFYLTPAILEQRLVNIKTMLNVQGGWQENMLGRGRNILFPINSPGTVSYEFIHEFLFLVVLFIAIVAVTQLTRKTPPKQQIWKEAIGWFVFALIIVFFMSQLSELIWSQFSILQKVQRPTRLMKIFSFGCAGLAATTASLLPKVRKPIRLLLVSVLAIFVLFNLRYSYKLSRSYPALHNPGRGEIVQLDRLKTTLYDPYSEKLLDVPEYRPLLPDGSSPPEPKMGTPKVQVITGDADVKIEQWKSNVRQLQVNSAEPSTIRIRTFYYPAWKLTVNGKPEEIERPNDGTMEVNVAAGTWTIILKYGGTLAFYGGIGISLISLTCFIIFSAYLMNGTRTQSS